MWIWNASSRQKKGETSSSAASGSWKAKKHDDDKGKRSESFIQTFWMEARRKEGVAILLRLSRAI